MIPPDDDELQDWSAEDRTSLLSAASEIARQGAVPAQIGLAMDTILDELEAFHDPRLGLGTWLFPNELPKLQELGQLLNQIAEPERPIEAGVRALDHPKWDAARQAAKGLVARMNDNVGPASLQPVDKLTFDRVA
ncbi:MAG: hypothetical protein H0W74_11825 [Sphingosinicella sp.]|nr:hypothetical protein [Sphingosinicella sp.]